MVQKSKVLVFGANGQLGYDITRVLESKGYEVLKPGSKELDICDFENVKGYIKENKPRFIINCAAFHDANECEKDIEKSYKINTVAVGELARICSEIGSVFVHISTDYVFSGLNRNKPYTEEDIPDPLMVYGLSKLAGEMLIPNFTKRYYIFRVASLFGVKGPSRKAYNFVDLMLKLAGDGRDKIDVVNDQYMTPTHTLDVAERLPEIITSDKFGLYHLTSEGQCTWFDFAKKIFKLSNIKIKVNPVPTEHFPADFVRPKYTVLKNKKYNSLFSNKMPLWEDALKRYLKLRKENKK